MHVYGFYLLKCIGRGEATNYVPLVDEPSKELLGIASSNACNFPLACFCS